MMTCPIEACAGESMLVLWVMSDVVPNKGELRNIKFIIYIFSYPQSSSEWSTRG